MLSVSKQFQVCYLPKSPLKRLTTREPTHPGFLRAALTRLVVTADARVHRYRTASARPGKPKNLPPDDHWFGA
jgi:hypothetical protein